MCTVLPTDTIPGQNAEWAENAANFHLITGRRGGMELKAYVYYSRQLGLIWKWTLREGGHFIPTSSRPSFM